ncbi:hypothetical protein HDU96_009184 [Phlyctochytrium bullatum]|nr:hypothetical protein HDU96_009184 [Phlyctochytrium bullatum]
MDSPPADSPTPESLSLYANLYHHYTSSSSIAASMGAPSVMSTATSTQQPPSPQRPGRLPYAAPSSVPPPQTTSQQPTTRRKSRLLLDLVHRQKSPARTVATVNSSRPLLRKSMQSGSSSSFHTATNAHSRASSLGDPLNDSFAPLGDIAAHNHEDNPFTDIDHTHTINPISASSPSHPASTRVPTTTALSPVSDKQRTIRDWLVSSAPSVPVGTALAGDPLPSAAAIAAAGEFEGLGLESPLAALTRHEQLDLSLSFARGSPRMPIPSAAEILREGPRSIQVEQVMDDDVEYVEYVDADDVYSPSAAAAAAAAAASVPVVATSSPRSAKTEEAAEHAATTFAKNVDADRQHRATAANRKRLLCILLIAALGVLLLGAAILAIVLTVGRRAANRNTSDTSNQSNGDGSSSSGSDATPVNGDPPIPSATPFPNLPALAASDSLIKGTAMPRPVGMAGARIVFDAAAAAALAAANNGTGPASAVPANVNIGEYRLARGDGGSSGAVAIHLGHVKGTSHVAMVQRWDFKGTQATLPGTSNPAWSTEYDYTTDTFRPLKLRSNVFCGGGMLAPDGRLMVVGGAENYTELGGLEDGMRAVRFLAPAGAPGKWGSSDWIDDPSNPRIQLNSKRWYPSVVMLPEGRMLLIGGTIVAVAFTSPPNNTGTLEFLPPLRTNYTDPSQGLIPLQFLWDTLPANLYPTTAVLPSGRLFIHASDRATLMDPATSYRALRTFFLRATAPGAVAAVQAAAGAAGVNVTAAAVTACVVPDPAAGIRDATRSEASGTVVGRMVVEACDPPTVFNQNATADHEQTFAFWGNPAPSPGDRTGAAGVGQFAVRDAYPGAGFLVHTLTRLCFAVVSGTGGTTARGVGMKRCVAEDPDVVFDVRGRGVRHVATDLCVTVGTGGAVGLGACGTAGAGIEMVDTSVYFEFPRLPGGPNRNYPWTGTGLLLPLDPFDNYDPAVMICGGAVHPEGLQAVETNQAIALPTCGTIRPERPQANWTMELMPSPRVLGDLVHLPDGTVLMLNGAKRGMAGWDLGRDPNLQAHLYNPRGPVGGRWSVLNSTTVPRMYHSTALLLPDGRVMVAGSSPNSPTDRNWSRMYENEFRVEYFYPPYLTQRGENPRPRPVIAEMGWKADTEPWSYNHTYSVRVGVRDPSATRTHGVKVFSRDELVARSRSTGAQGSGPVLRFNLVQTGFRTHSTAFGDRLVWLLDVVPEGSAEGEVVLAAPPSAAVAPPGWYLLHAVLDGVPSEGRWVQVGGDPAGVGEFYAGL